MTIHRFKSMTNLSANFEKDPEQAFFTYDYDAEDDK